MRTGFGKGEVKWRRASGESTLEASLDWAGNQTRAQHSTIGQGAGDVDNGMFSQT